MDIEAVRTRVESACRELGVDGPLARQIAVRAFPVGPDGSSPAMVGGLPGSVGHPSGQAERDRTAKIQHEVMGLLGAKSPDRIVHDLRNVLNELGLLRALAGEDKDKH